MAYIRSKLTSHAYVHIPYWFITDYMPKALSGDLKVYLYLFALSSDPKGVRLSLEEVSQNLDMLYSELLQALRHWHKKKVIHFEEISKEEYNLEFYLEKPEVPVKNIAPEIVKEPVKPSLNKTIIAQSRPEYRVEELNYYLESSSEVTRLFKIAEQYLGRLLTITDQKIIFSFYDWLHMPFDLIEFLIEYCASNNHKAIHYIEKVAINWVDQGILTVEQAKEKIAQNKSYFQVLSALGCSKDSVTAVERDCINKWLSTYHFSMDIILEACKRTVMQTNKPSLNYADRILTSWYHENIQSLEDIAKLDKAYESKKAITQSKDNKQAPAKPTKITKFNNIYSHNWDYDELEKLEREYIERTLNGGG